jgi:hypothetical protein
LKSIFKALLLQGIQSDGAPTADESKLSTTASRLKGLVNVDELASDFVGVSGGILGSASSHYSIGDFDRSDAAWPK